MREERCGQCGHSKRWCNCREIPVPPNGGSAEVQKGRQEIIEYLEAGGVIRRNMPPYYFHYEVEASKFDDRWYALKGSPPTPQRDKDEGEDGESYERRYVGFIDDLTTDLWGGAGPDCRTRLVVQNY